MAPASFRSDPLLMSSPNPQPSLRRAAATPSPPTAPHSYPHVRHDDVRRHPATGTIPSMEWWSPELVTVTAMFAAVAGFLWTLHRDMRGLSERVASDMRGLSERIARVEGLLEGMRPTVAAGADQAADSR